MGEAPGKEAAGRRSEIGDEVRGHTMANYAGKPNLVVEGTQEAREQQAVWCVPWYVARLARTKQSFVARSGKAGGQGTRWQQGEHMVLGA